MKPLHNLIRHYIVFLIVDLTRRYQN